MITIAEKMKVEGGKTVWIKTKNPNTGRWSGYNQVMWKGEKELFDTKVGIYTDTSGRAVKFCITEISLLRFFACDYETMTYHEFHPFN